MSASELRAKEAELRKEAFNLRLQTRIGKVENPLRSRIVRRELARVLTISNQLHTNQ